MIAKCRLLLAATPLLLHSRTRLLRGIGCANRVALARARFDSRKLGPDSSDQIMARLPFFPFVASR